ncbi:MAG: hypothetical protein ACLR56_13270 [Oscillospiraceae bacterium]
MSVSGALFDNDKLNDVRPIYQKLGDTVYDRLTEWARESIQFYL